jgi:hypothetical protein
VSINETRACREATNERCNRKQERMTRPTKRCQQCGGSRYGSLDDLNVDQKEKTSYNGFSGWQSPEQMCPSTPALSYV